MRMEATEMNRIVRTLVVITIFSAFLLIQTMVVNEQRSEILHAQNSLNEGYQEYASFNNIEVDSEAKILQEHNWAEIENSNRLDFTEVLENLQRSFQNHGWIITGFRRLEKEITEESETEELITTDPNNLVKHKTISYEMQFFVMDRDIIFPLEIFCEAAENISVDSITILINDEDIQGILNITYTQLEINDASALDI